MVYDYVVFEFSPIGLSEKESIAQIFEMDLVVLQISSDSQSKKVILKFSALFLS